MRKKTGLFVFLAVSAMIFSSCGKDKVPEPGGPEVEEVGALTLPPDVIGFASVKSLTDITTAATDIGSAFNKGLGPLVGGQVTALLQARLIGTRNMTWMDPSTPMRLVVLDPAKYKAPFLFVGAVSHEEGLKTAMDGLTGEIDGNSASFKGKNGRTMYLNRIGKFAVFSMEAGTWAVVSDFVRKDLLRHPGNSLVDIQTGSRGLKGVIKPLVDARIVSADMNTPKLMDFVAAELSDLLELLDQTSAVRLTLGYDKGILKIEGSALPLEGSVAARFAADGPERKLKKYKQFPVEGWAEVASNIDPLMFQGVSVRSLESMGKFVSFTPEEKAEWEKLLAENIAVQGGENAVSVSYDNKFPFRVMEIVDLKDPKKGREIIERTWGLLFEKFGAIAVVAMKKVDSEGTPMPQVDFSSLDSMVSSSRDYLASQGLAATVRDVREGGVDIRALDLSIDAGMFAPNDPEIAKFREVLGSRLSGGVGFDDSSMYLSVGRDSVGDINRIRSASGSGGTRLDGHISSSDFDVMVAARVSLVDAGIIAAQVHKGVLGRLPSLETATVRPDLAVTAGSRAGRVIAGMVSIPVEGIAALMQPAPPAADGRDSSEQESQK